MRQTKQINESPNLQKRRMVKVIERLRKEYPKAQCSLTYRDPHQLLVATILSAQCTDKRVNVVTKQLFKKYSSVEAFAYADENELSDDIRSCGYHNQKARSIKGASLMICEDYAQDMPNTIEKLTALPGVGRKTANCILGTAFGIPAMVIDTHMVRIMGLLGFTESKNPEKIEMEIREITPKEDWITLTHLIIEHGRQICIARKPRCVECILSDICPSSPVG